MAGYTNDLLQERKRPTFKVVWPEGVMFHLRILYRVKALGYNNPTMTPGPGSILHHRAISSRSWLKPFLVPIPSSFPTLLPPGPWRKMIPPPTVYHRPCGRPTLSPSSWRSYHCERRGGSLSEPTLTAGLQQLIKWNQKLTPLRLCLVSHGAPDGNRRQYEPYPLAFTSNDLYNWE